jgi:hypothetical protein
MGDEDCLHAGVSVVIPVILEIIRQVEGLILGKEGNGGAYPFGHARVPTNSGG